MTKQKPIRIILLGLGALTSCAVSQPVGRDFNNDGTLDYPVSVTDYNETTLPKGAARLWSGASKQAIQTIVADSPNTLFGYSIESAGDIDGDGYDDVVVGEPLWGYSDAWHGRLHIYSGQDGSLIRSIIGPYAEIALGRYVAGVGDWNGDGTPDIASSAWVTVDTFGTGSTDDGYGIVFIFSGLDGSILAEITDLTATNRFGFGVFGLGDVDGDGKADIAITDPTADGVPASGAIGNIYIYNGTATPDLSLDFADASELILNSDPSIRTFGAQIDTMHPNRWLDMATIQVLSLTNTDLSGGVTDSEFATEIIKIDGTFTGSKGVRSNLIDAGDIDMNGIIDSADVQASTGQYGTSPNFNGVMPVADINKDGIVDAYDIQTVLQSFGATSNIFKDLWNDTRLRAIGGSASGFGSRPGGSNITPSGGFDSHPIDDCPPSISTGPSNSESILPYLLGLDAQTNCPSCPACDSDDINDCYDCNTLGSMSGAGVSVDDSSPTAGQTVVFTVDPLSWSGHKERCDGGGGCGETPNTCNIYHDDTTASYTVEILNTNGGWVTLSSNRWSASSPPSPNHLKTEISVLGLACEQIRVRSNNTRYQMECGTITHETKTAVSFTDFEIESKTIVSAPDDSPDDRRIVGLTEQVRFTSSDGLAKNWKYEFVFNGQTYMQTSPGPAPAWETFAPSTETSMNVIATSPSDPTCESRLSLNVIAPDFVDFELLCEKHINGTASAGFVAKPKFGPYSVSFSRTKVREGKEIHAAVAVGIWSNNHGDTHEPSGYSDINVLNEWIGTDCVAIRYPNGAHDPSANPPIDYYGFYIIEIEWDYKELVYQALHANDVNFDSLLNYAFSNSSGYITDCKGSICVGKAIDDPELGWCIPGAPGTCP